MTGHQLRQKYLDFFKKHQHSVISPAPLVLRDDPTTLFTGSGMQPLVPYLLGKKHPQGSRLVNSQPAFRAEDIHEVGDDRHTTFFEMLGNWSLGDYFKQQQLSWFWEFLTVELQLPPEKLFVTVFVGDKQNSIPQDKQSEQIWQQLFSDSGIKTSSQLGTQAAQNGLKKNTHIFYYGDQNWWSRQGSPDKMSPQALGGPDSEIFYEFTQVKHNPKFGPHCHPNCNCGRFFEIGNSVFMQYQKQQDGSFAKLTHPNVDFGGGLERLLAVVQDTPDIFLTDLFKPVIDHLSEITGTQYQKTTKTHYQIIADHLKAATFMIAHSVTPSNKKQGYILRRLLRDASMSMYHLTKKTASQQLVELVQPVICLYKKDYPLLLEQEQLIQTTISTELEKFSTALQRGLDQLKQYPPSQINEQTAFHLYQTHGLPLKITQQLLSKQSQKLDKELFNRLKKEHAQKSRSTSQNMFKGGLADHSRNTIMYHTTTHLIHQALREVLGDHVKQTGSNITQQRLRFDFTHPQKLTKSQVKKIQSIANHQIDRHLPVNQQIMSLKNAQKSGVLALFTQKYHKEDLKVYQIGDFSLEVCNGPHVKNTQQLKHIKIYKQKSIGAGKRRIYAKFA